MGDARVASLEVQLVHLERRVRDLEEMIDTRNTPAWKRAVFRLDGWGPWHQLRERPRWRPWRRWFLSVLVLVLLAPAAQAGPQEPLSFTLSQDTDIQNPVEQQTPGYAGPCDDPYRPGWCQHDQSLWVINPTLCAWDADDVVIWWTGYALGLVPAGATVTGSVCVIADGYEGWAGDNKTVQAFVAASKRELVVTVTSDQGLSWTVEPVYDPTFRQWTWSFCHRDFTGYPNPPEWYPVVDGSNGGRGIVVNYTVSITAPGATVRQAQAWIGAFSRVGCE